VFYALQLNRINAFFFWLNNGHVLAVDDLVVS